MLTPCHDFSTNGKGIAKLKYKLAELSRNKRRGGDLAKGKTVMWMSDWFHKP
jgi:hypothetical protein